jgi:carboxyl-terminal processing protease
MNNPPPAATIDCPMRHFRVLIAAAALLVAGASVAAETLTPDPFAPFSAAFGRAIKTSEEAEQYRELFAAILRRVQRTYAQEVELAPLVDAAVKALVPLKPAAGEPASVFKSAVSAALALLDPYSTYYDAREFRDQRSAMSGTFSGLGLQVDLSEEGLVRIVSTMENAPAARAGLQSGDLIARLDEHPVLGMTLQEAISRMRGEPGTPISLTILRAGNELAVSLVRETIGRQALRWSFEDDVLVLKLAMFNDSIASELHKALDEATAQRTPRAVVLDMRGNPGGRLDQALAIADAFLANGEITSLRGRTERNRRSWKADPEERLAGAPMVVLVDGRSASASELVAAALQDNRRAIVIGQRSFGKGSVQSIVPLGSEKGALRLTTALYHAPSGRAVQRTGVGPDIEVAAAPAPTSRAARREADRNRALPGADEPSAPKARVEGVRCTPAKASDPVLACALAYLRAGALEPFLAALAPLKPELRAP